MIQNTNTTTRNCLLLFILTCSVTACTKVDVSFGDTTITDPNISYIDTISYQLNTIQSDSFITSQTGSFLTGQCSDPDFGVMKAETYMHIGTPGIAQVPDIAVYDSAKLWIQHNGNYYGDTTAPINLEVYTMDENIDLDGETYFYNNKSLRAATNKIGVVSYTARPSEKASIGIPININFATGLFNWLKTNDEAISDNDHFFQYVKGIGIKNGINNKTIYTYNCADSNLYIRLYYHTSNPNPVGATVDFKFVSDNLQFNHIETNRAGTALAAITPNIKQKVASSLTANKSFLQTAGGLQVRIDLPFLRNFRTENVYRKILRAEMYVKPYGYSSASMYKLPSNMILRKISDDNLADSVVIDNINYAQQSVAPVIDDLYGENNYYVYDITSYINAIINGSSEQYEGLMFETPSFSTNTGVDRLILADGSLYKSIVIKIYRLTL